MAAPDQGEVRDPSMLRVTQCSAVPASRGVAAELKGRFPKRPGTRIGPGSRLKRAVSRGQYAQRGLVIESYLAETRPRGKVSPGVECARNLRSTGIRAPRRWARRQGDEERRRPLGARAGWPGVAGLRNHTALRPPAACSP